MDRRLFDILWKSTATSTAEADQIISSYRSPPPTLRRRSAGVARFSQHMLGHAMDFYIPDVPWSNRFAGRLRATRQRRLLSDLRIAIRASRYRQHPALAAHDPAQLNPELFPDKPHRARPTDGNPLKDMSSPAPTSRSAPPPTTPRPAARRLLAALFKGRSNEDDEGAAPAGTGSLRRPAWWLGSPPAETNPPKRADAAREAANRGNPAARIG
jgi:hypothetical protein